jgi:hypothetical protein
MSASITSIFNEHTRPDGEKFYSLAEPFQGTPVQDWIRDSVHNGIFPNDFAYDLARTIALWAIEELMSLTDDDRTERLHEITSDIAQNYSDRVSLANFIRYCDGFDAIDDFVSEGLIELTFCHRASDMVSQGMYWFIERALQSFPYDTFTAETSAAASA